MTTLAPEYRRPIQLASIQQAIILTLAALILDGGLVLRSLCVASLAQWAMIGMIVARRPRSPSKFDLGLIRYGLWMIVGLMLIVVPAVHGLRGAVHRLTWVW